ncbi:MAG TPA: tRNA pseudouridine(38-40) synthase TruA [Candidatus Acidoferrum sp.]|nr:tRNA pseudouridine(38-40) synthase TruA [Candidatus Acidoferrum sp.]
MPARIGCIEAGQPVRADRVLARDDSLFMRYFKLTIAYDGTDFHGWQMQKSKATIQGEIVAVLRRLTQEEVQLNGSGRTDAGVHALGQVANFRTESGLSAAEFQRALNALLPMSIRITAAEETGPAFNARFSAKGKIYRYRVYRGKVVPPFLWRYVLHYPFPLDEEAMKLAAARFVGVHDFSSFAASTGSEDDDKERNMVREIYSAELKRTEDGEELWFTVYGHSFLRYMVRKMMGTLLEVGRGKLVVRDVERLFEMKDRSKSGPTAPPQGLCMLKVEHEEGFRV